MKEMKSNFKKTTGTRLMSIFIGTILPGSFQLLLQTVVRYIYYNSHYCVQFKARNIKRKGKKKKEKKIKEMKSNLKKKQEQD